MRETRANTNTSIINNQIFHNVYYHFVKEPAVVQCCVGYSICFISAPYSAFEFYCTIFHVQIFIPTE